MMDLLWLLVAVSPVTRRQQACGTDFTHDISQKPKTRQVAVYAHWFAEKLD